MAIAFDNNADYGPISSGSLSTSFAIGGAGSGLMLLFMSASATVTSITWTYAGSPFTLLNTYTWGANGRTLVFYLIGPATGTNTLSGSWSSASFPNVNVLSYTGVLQTGFPDASHQQTGTGTSFSGSITTVLDKCWVAAITGQASFAGTITSPSNWTLRNTTNSFSTSGDSNAAVTPAGSFTQGGTNSSNGSSAWSLVQISFGPAPVAPPSSHGFFMQMLQT